MRQKKRCQGRDDVVGHGVDRVGDTDGVGVGVGDDGLRQDDAMDQQQIQI